MAEAKRLHKQLLLNYAASLSEHPGTSSSHTPSSVFLVTFMHQVVQQMVLQGYRCFKYLDYVYSMRTLERLTVAEVATPEFAEFLSLLL